MKKWLSFVMVLLLVCTLSGCVRKTYEIKVTIPAGSTAEYVFADTQIVPTKDTVTLSANAGFSDTEVLLRGKTASQKAYLTKGMPVELDVNKGECYQLGVAVQNPSDEEIYVLVKVEGAEVRME